jgi:hypothetical protein
MLRTAARLKDEPVHSDNAYTNYIDQPSGIPIIRHSTSAHRKTQSHLAKPVKTPPESKANPSP